MNALNNKRYLMRILICGLFLCSCFAVDAQEMQTPEPTAVKMLDVPTVFAPAEEIKAVEIKSEEPINERKSEGIVGLASYYAAKFHGKRTASGERFSSKLLTAAHLTLPFGTLLKVTNLRNMKSATSASTTVARMCGVELWIYRGRRQSCLASHAAA